jgi:hypothetical protein
MEMDKFGHPIHPRGLNETKSLVHITNLTFNKLIMKIMGSLFIHRFIHFVDEYHASKTHLIHK